MRRALPPTYFSVAIALTVLLHFVFPVRQLLEFPWRLLGLAPLAAGIVLNLMADQAFKRHRTTVKPFETSETLVTDGVFSLSRNPMYLGMTLMLLGIAAILGSATPFAVVPVYAMVMDTTFIAPEEEMLEQTFHDQFRDYRKRVHRWI